MISTFIFNIADKTTNTQDGHIRCTQADVLTVTSYGKGISRLIKLLCGITVTELSGSLNNICLKRQDRTHERRNANHIVKPIKTYFAV